MLPFKLPSDDVANLGKDTGIFEHVCTNFIRQFKGNVGLDQHSLFD